MMSTSCIRSRFVSSVIVLSLNTTVLAQSAPDRALVSLQRAQYQDWQAGAERIAINTPSLYFQVPVSGPWVIDGSWTVDSISGASPLYHDQALKPMEDRRLGRYVRLSHFGESATINMALARSDERDYKSHAVSSQFVIHSADRNSSYHIGTSLTSDAIHTKSIGEREKYVRDFLLGWTQVWSPQDIAQLQFQRSLGRGYFSDPYKLIDQRPSDRHYVAISWRWNHSLPTLDATVRVSLRRFEDSWEIKSNTAQIDWVQGLDSRLPGWSITPTFRLYAQSPARFYLPPVNSPYPTIPNPLNETTLASMDQRLSGFGARTLGTKLSYLHGPKTDPDFVIDARFDLYEQRQSWKISVPDKPQDLPGLKPFKARWVTIVLTHWFK